VTKVNSARIRHIRCRLIQVALAAVASHALSIAASAQSGGISGKVVDVTTQLPIENAIVSVGGSTLTATTLSNGGFTLLGVPPGFHTVTAKRFGFAGHAITHVEVRIGRTRVLKFNLRPSTSDSVETTEVDSLFLDPKIGTANLSLNRDQLLSLPSITLAGGLGINGGYLTLPRSSSTLSRSDFRRGVTSLASVRGARSEATLYLLESFDVSNPVMGMPPVLIEPLAAASVSFSPAHVDAEHGPALAGLVNQSIRQGGDEISAALEYQTTALASVFGAKGNDATRARAVRGSLAGPVPFTGDAVRFSVAGHLLGDRVTVIKPRGADWTGFGDYSHDQVVTKLTYAIRPKLLLSVAGLAQRRLAADVDPNFIRGDSVAPATTRDGAAFLVARLEKRFNRAMFSVAFASNQGRRETCSIWEGVCVEDRIQRIPQGEEIPAFGPPPRQTPYAASGQYFGGESFRTSAVRFDGVVQATDHHQIRIGLYGAGHEISYNDAIGVRWLQGVTTVVRDVYRTRPVELSTYVQDEISHDLISLHIGVRFDVGNLGGLAFTNPRIPTNGTTAREVCNGDAPGINEERFSYGGEYGIIACINSPDRGSGRPFLLDSAARLAQADDFRAVKPRVAFSPRIGLSFPVTETSGMFFNFGRYSRNPLYHDAYRYTGLGSRAGLDNGDRMCDRSRRPAGSSECAPSVLLDPLLPDFVGNPNLSFETANNWEAGFTMQAGALHSVESSFYSTSLSHIPTLVSQTQVPDFGQTYGAVGDRSVRTVLSSGAHSTLGVSLTVRRRLQNGYSYSVNYSWQRADEIGGRPDLLAEAAAAAAARGGVADLSISERTGVRSRPHMLNAQFAVQWRDNVPKTLGRVGRILLNNSRAVATLTAASGNALYSQGISTGRVAGVENLIDLMYTRAIVLKGPQWTFVTRVQNVLNANDGTRDLIALRGLSGAPPGTRAPIEDVLRRRILTGMAVSW
jgi:hypothetical protein